MPIEIVKSIFFSVYHPVFYHILTLSQSIESAQNDLLDVSFSWYVHAFVIVSGWFDIKYSQHQEAFQGWWGICCLHSQVISVLNPFKYWMSLAYGNCSVLS